MLLSYEPAAKKSRLTSALYYKDTAEQMECDDPNMAPIANDRLLRRHHIVADSQVVDMMGCIHGDLFFQDKYNPKNVSLRIHLVRQKDAFSLMSDEANVVYKINVQDQNSQLQTVCAKGETECIRDCWSRQGVGTGECKISRMMRHLQNVYGFMW